LLANLKKPSKNFLKTVTRILAADICQEYQENSWKYVVSQSGFTRETYLLLMHYGLLYQNIFDVLLHGKFLCFLYTFFLIGRQLGQLEQYLLFGTRPQKQLTTLPGLLGWQSIRGTYKRTWFNSVCHKNYFKKKTPSVSASSSLGNLSDHSPSFSILPTYCVTCPMQVSQSIIQTNTSNSSS
jgi:hypothetical protein